MKSVKYGKGSYFKRNCKVWPWGYYVPSHWMRQSGQSGLFVCDSEAEAKRQLDRR
jgi:hypothetical protein